MEKATKAQRGSRGIALSLSFTSALVGVGGQRHAPAGLPLGNTRYPCTGGWVGPRVGLDGFKDLAPVTSRFTDWAIPAHN
jgi:hypothetical protein